MAQNVPAKVGKKIIKIALWKNKQKVKNYLMKYERWQPKKHSGIREQDPELQVVIVKKELFSEVQKKRLKTFHWNNEKRKGQKAFS